MELKDSLAASVIDDNKVFSSAQIVQVEYSSSCLICSVKITDSHHHDHGTDSHDGNNERNENEIFQRFSILICRYLNISSEQFKFGQEKTLKNRDFNPNRNVNENLSSVKLDVDVELNNKYKICNGCVREADNFCRMYGEWHSLNLKLNWCLKRITGLMNAGVTEADRENEVCRFREKILNNAQKKINLFPEVRLTRTKTTTKTKEKIPKLVKGRKRKFPNCKIKTDPYPVTDSSVTVKAEPHLSDDGEDFNFEPIDDPPFNGFENEPSNKESFKTTQKKKKRKEKKSYVCDICGRNFYSNATLKDHHTVFHQESVKFFKCDMCTKEFALLENLRRHQKCSHGTRQFVCHVCGKAYGLQTMLRRHMKSHTEKKSFQCEVCGMAFVLKQHLKRHMITHTDEKPLKCGICGERFKHWPACKSHLKKAHEILETEEGYIINESITRFQNRSRWSKTKRTGTTVNATYVEAQSEHHQSSAEQRKNESENEITVEPTVIINKGESDNEPGLVLMETE